RPPLTTHPPTRKCSPLMCQHSIWGLTQRLRELIQPSLEGRCQPATLQGSGQSRPPEWIEEVWVLCPNPWPMVVGLRASERMKTPFVRTSRSAHPSIQRHRSGFETNRRQSIEGDLLLQRDPHRGLVEIVLAQRGKVCGNRSVVAFTLELSR